MNMTNTLKREGNLRCMYDKNGYIGVLTISGDLTPECSQELNMRLKKAMNDADFVVVNLDQVTSVDPDCCTLFCMASRMAYTVNKRLHLGCAKPELPIVASFRCNLSLSSAELNECDTHCFWLNQRSDNDCVEMR